MRWSYEDVNLDGFVDLVFHFKKRDMSLWGNPPENCAEVELTALLFDGTPAMGVDVLCTPGGVNCEGEIPIP